MCNEIVRGCWRFQSYIRGGWVSMQAHKRGSIAPTERPTSIYANVYPDPVTRGRALTIFMTVSETHGILPLKMEEHAVKPTISPSLVAATAAVSEHVPRSVNIRGHLRLRAGLYLVICMIGLSACRRC